MRKGCRRSRSRSPRRALRAALVAVAVTGCVQVAGAVEPPPAPGRWPLAGTKQAGTKQAGTTQAAPLSLLGLGDSVTSGAHCDCTPFLDQLAGLLADRDHTPVSPVNLGVAGLTAAALADQVSDDPAVRLAVGRADVVVVTIGANDLSPALDRWDQSGLTPASAPGCAGGSEAAALLRVGADLARVLDQVAALRAERPTRVLVTGYWNVFEDGDVAAADRGSGYLRWSDQLTRCLNDRIDTAAHAHGAVPVDLYTPFKGAGDQDPTPLLADDGDHPDAAGHALIARVLLGALARGATG